MHTASFGRSPGRGLLWLLASLCLGLSACGGSGSDAAGTAATERTAHGDARENSPAFSAWLNAQSLDSAEQAAVQADRSPPLPLDQYRPGQAVPKRAYDSGEVVRKAAALRIPVYRFYNTQTTAHFYTTSETEKANILATLPQFQLDGTAFYGANAFSPGLSPVYRFYNSQSGVHFYTISETEKANILATLPHLVLEGPAYYASQVSGQGLTALYRFYVPSKGFHFYTASSAERDNIIATLGTLYSYEGTAYYVPTSTWNADKLPHTGITTSQCYGRNLLTATDFFGTCGLLGVSTTLYSQQDSARTTHNPMSYSSVIRRVGLLFVTEPKTNCVYDNVTGLYWEGKTDDGGLRDKDNTYTNQGGGASTDASGYVAAVNATSLCGFTDWRMPTALELMSLNDYGRNDAAPFVDPVWFPNTVSSLTYWTGETRGTGNHWVVTHEADRWEVFGLDTGPRAVRLVRGNMGNVTGGRYTYSTMAFGTDGANNVVNDKLTGLQWRRCLEGQVWNGSACTGTPTTYTHREALVYANGSGLPASGWRLPNAKEGSSLLNKAATASPYLDSTAFPGATGDSLWTSTARVSDGMSYSYLIVQEFGWLDTLSRSSYTFSIRLVR